MYLPPLECKDQMVLWEKKRDILYHCSMQISVSRSRPSRNTKKSREDCLPKTPVIFIEEIFKSEDVHDLGSIHSSIYPNFVIDN